MLQDELPKKLKKKELELNYDKIFIYNHENSIHGLEELSDLLEKT